MDVGRTGEIPDRFKFTFNAHETDVLRAAHREIIFTLATRANPSAIKPDIANWANFPEGQKASIFNLNGDVPSLTAILIEFANNTTDVLTDIALQTASTPGFANPYVPLRFVLGEQARQLVGEISTKTASFIMSEVRPDTPL